MAFDPELLPPTQLTAWNGCALLLRLIKWCESQSLQFDLLAVFS